MGDAELPQRLPEACRGELRSIVARMSELAEGMVRDSLNAVVRGDQELAQSVLLRDDQVDRLRDQMFRELLTHMMEKFRGGLRCFRADSGGKKS